MKPEHSADASAASAVVTMPLVVASASRDAGQPVSFGVPLRAGELPTRPATATLMGSNGERTTAQTAQLGHWPDGSIRWLGVDAVLPAAAKGAQWQLELKPAARNGRAGPHDHESISLASGVRCGMVNLMFDERRDQRAAAAAVALNADVWSITDQAGRHHRPELRPPQASAVGAVRTTIVQSGEFPELNGLRLHVRWSVYPAAQIVRCDVTLHNPRRAKHPRGIWDLGDAGSVLLKDFSFRLDLTDAEVDGLSLDVHATGQWHRATHQAAVYQDSSGGENWRSDAHKNRDGVVPVRFRGFQLQCDDRTTDGLRAAPVVHVAGKAWNVTLAAPEFWQQFPKAVSATPDALRLGLFPGEFGDLHELQGGERKRHTFWLQFDPSGSPPANLQWAFAPAIVTPMAEACVDAGAIPPLDVAPSDACDTFHLILDEALAGERGILALRERVDEYGWRNFGDMHADHEAVYYRGAEPFISHYNNQFDVLLGLLWQYLRTEDVRWFRLADELARHVIDIDIYHTQEDKSAYNGGLFWFTDHYLTAHECTHRTYSAKNASPGVPYGGGPGAEHNFTAGLLLYHWLTGCPAARAAVLELADWVIAMEDGGSTVFGLVDDGATGAATVYMDKPSRGGANSVSALVDAWTLTGERRFVEFAELLIRRCIHPRDDVAALDLLDAEYSWSYTMFLTSLAKYASAKEQAGERDDAYRYAVASLLHYATWMLAHERPYLDHPEQLEYPTEAWAAQELRKANVLRRAARYAGEPLAGQLRCKGDEFGDRAWQDLLSFDATRATIRAVAIVMTEGLIDCASRGAAEEAVAVPKLDGEWPDRPPFSSQKQRVSSMMKRPAGLVRIAARLANPGRWRRLAARRAT
jgi:hypothetical protein